MNMQSNISCPALSIEHLTVGRRRDVPLMRGLDVSLQCSELTCLMGSNGVGKSTLLQTICGFIPPLEGDVVIAGKPIRRFKPSALARMVGVVLTERPSAMNMTVEEIVGLGRTPYTSFMGKLSAADHHLVDEAIALVDIEPLRKRLISQLSDGERQKAMIAKVLAQQTPIILLDEPTAFLDYPSKVDIMRLLADIAHTRGKSVLMSTHDIHLALQIADRLWLVDPDEGFRSGTPDELAKDGTLARRFERPGLRMGIMNMLDNRL